MAGRTRFVFPPNFLCRSRTFQFGGGLRYCTGHQSHRHGGEGSSRGGARYSTRAGPGRWSGPPATRYPIAGQLGFASPRSLRRSSSPLISIPLNTHHTRRGIVQRLKIDTVRLVLLSRCFHLADHCSLNFSEFKLSTTLIRCKSAYSTLANMETHEEATSTLSVAPLFFYCEVRPPPS